MAEVEIRAVSKAFKKTHAVSDLSLTVGDGEFVALLGPTGAGKTTTLRLIAGLEMPDRGSIRIDGRSRTGPRRSPPSIRRPTCRGRTSTAVASETTRSTSRPQPSSSS